MAQAMSVIVISDIFGRTPALVKLCSDLPAATEILDPYEGRTMGFQQESEAYHYFMNRIGIEQYSEVLVEKCLRANSTVKLVGFSVGASAIWKVSSELSAEVVSGGFCFYGSQIRQFTSINPLFKIEMIFPKEEKNFSVNELSQLLSHKFRVNVHNTNYLHGFMNPCSTNYDQTGYEMYLQWLSKRAI